MLRSDIRVRPQAALALWLATAGLLACATPPQPRSSGSGPQSSLAPAEPKRMVAAVMGNTRTFSNKVERSGAGSTPGSEELEEMLNAGLAIRDDRAELRPLLAQAVPTIENGLWKVFPDGRMETTWTIRPGVVWHDGTPFTADDLVFTAAVVADPELPAFRDIAFDSLERVEAMDARTVVAQWKQPYIEADTLFTRVRGQPLPKHILEGTFISNKWGLLDLPYWNYEFVGLGPFRLREYVSGSHAVLEANDRYILGRPKLDEIQVRFIPDYNTLMANFLAGAVELNLGRSLSLDNAVKMRDQWRDGRMDLGALTSWIAIYPQFINPSPPITGNLQFRRALYHAVDRQQMAEEFMLGMVPVAHSLIAPEDAEYPAIEGHVLRYEYDTRRAAQLLEGLGLARGPDGAFRDPAGQPLTVHTQTSVGNDLQEKSMFAVGEYWRRLGLTVEPDVVQALARTDRARRAARPGFEVQKQPKGVDALIRYPGNQTPLPENSFVGNNRSRYRSAEFDTFLDRYFTTIPRVERMQALGQVIRHMTEQLNAFGLIFDADPVMVGNRLQSVGAPRAQGPTSAWNAHEWDIR